MGRRNPKQIDSRAPDCTATHKCKAPVSTETKIAIAELRLEGVVHREGWDLFGSAARRRELAGSRRRTAVLAVNRTAERGGYWGSAGGEARGTEWKSGGLCFLGIGQEGEGSGT